jgi:hypothetical protein
MDILADWSDRFVTNSDGGSQAKAHAAGKRTDDLADVADGPSAESRARTEEITQETEDLLDDIDAALRASLDLDKDASDELFAERAALLIAQNIQKGGE